MLWVGGEEADVNIEIDFYDLITKSIKNNVSLILDVSDALKQSKKFAERRKHRFLQRKNFQKNNKRCCLDEEADVNKIYTFLLPHTGLFT